MARVFMCKKRNNLAVIDSQFPQKYPLGFRNIEINEYLKRVKNIECYSMYPMQPGPDAWFSHGYGVTEETFVENKEGYLGLYPENKEKVHHLDPLKSYRFTLAYSFFLAETYVLLPFLEKNKIPFVFVLYPGGGFGLNNSKSDDMLRAIFRSRYFRGVITTQRITRDYLINTKLCSPEKVHFIYGGFVQFKEEDVQPKKYYKIDKQTFDICFVAAKYSEKGVDKGYDLFIKAAKKIARASDDIRFHVIGGFDEQDIGVQDIKERITFYGYKQQDFLRNFYSSMDIFVGPGRPFKLFEGNFDGFPLGIDAGYCGVALFVTDELKMNNLYRENEEIVILPLSSSVIAGRIMEYYRNTDKLYRLSARGQKKTQELFNTDRQVSDRLKVFEKYMNVKYQDQPYTGKV